MEIIRDFLVAMSALNVAIKLTLIAGGIGLALYGTARRRSLLVALGVAVVVSPFAGPLLANMLVDRAVANRRAEVARFERHRLPPDYPRTLVADGHLGANIIRNLLAEGYFDVIERDDYGVERFTFASERPGCAAERQPPRRRGSGKRSLPKDCLHVVRGGPPLASDRIVLRLGPRAQRKARGRTHAAPRAVEIEMLRGGRESLIVYEEMPVIARGPEAFAIIGSTDDYPCHDFDIEQILRNAIDAARDPANAEALMLRQPERTRCVVAPEPRRDRY